MTLPDSEKHLIAFEDQKIRRKRHNGEWWFSIVDVVGVLSESSNARRYWSDLKRKIEQEQGMNELYEKIVQLKMSSADGKFYETDCANTETMLRVIQSIPSPKAEPLKLWLARVGFERIQEIENPELTTQRTRALYKAKGYPDSWIDKRMRGIAVRETLVKEWDQRGVKGTREYAILTAEIAQATFGMNPGQHKKHKGLGGQHNLRDHMNDLELIFAMLGEAATTEIAQAKDAQGFGKNRKAAIEGGKVAGKARKELETTTGRRVVSRGNYLSLAAKENRKIQRSQKGK